MDIQFFLAANSGRGFYSCYEDFPGAAFLHILKGGPGTGKSSFLKRIRERAAARGLDTESIRCSGDPDSLDGLLIPALGLAWADGTAPHVLEPRVFGVDGDYVNLGRFCRRLDGPAADRARGLNSAYKARYREAYALLRGALAIEEAGRNAGEQEPATSLIRRSLEQQPNPVEGKGGEERRFLSAISCKGLFHLEETEKMLCKQMISLPNSVSLEEAARQAAERGLRQIRCLQPLDPARMEALLLPELALGFRLEVPERRETALYDAVLGQAMERLREAKALHDELEAVYRPFVDFEALTAFTEEYLDGLF